MTAAFDDTFAGLEVAPAVRRKLIDDMIECIAVQAREGRSEAWCLSVMTEMKGRPGNRSFLLSFERSMA